MNKMSQEKSYTPETERTKITKIHFLIHPGYDTDPNTLLNTARTATKSPNIKKALTKEEILLKYQPVAQNMGEQEIMIAFLHTKKYNRIKKDIQDEQPYLEIINKLKQILTKRLIVLSGTFEIADRSPIKGPLEAKRAFTEILKIVRARGYEISEEVEGEAFGEYAEHCVREAKLNLNQATIIPNHISTNTEASIE